METSASPVVRPESALDHLLFTNDPPLNTEIPVIRNIIADEHSRLADLDARIAAVRKVLGPLVSERNTTAENLLRHESILSVVRRIPPETLGEIFLLTVPSIDQAYSHATLSVDLGPWLVARVCSHWRKVALSLPSLWTTIAVTRNYNLSIDRSPTLPLHRLKLVLERSVKQPLQIHIVHKFPDFELTGSDNFFEALADSSPRWETVHSPGSLFRLYMDRIEGKLDMLKSLTFYRESSAPGNLFAAAPQLCRIDCGYGLPRGDGFPWAQITHFTGGAFSLHLLPQLVNLVECQLSNEHVDPHWDNEDSDDVDPPDFTLPALEKLIISDVSFPSSLIAPSLYHISLGPHDLGGLARLVSRSACDLQKLKIAPVWGIEVEASAFLALEQCPTISEVEIHGTEGINALCAMLHNSPFPLPNLKSLTLTVFRVTESGFSDLDIDALVTTLKSRWEAEGCARIGHVHIDVSWHVEPSAIEDLRCRLAPFDARELALWLTDEKSARDNRQRVSRLLW